MSTVKSEVLANLFGVSTKTILELSRRGIVLKAGKAQFEFESSIRSYVTHLREIAAAAGRPAQSGTGKERSRLAAAQADKAELANARQRGALVDAEAVAAEWEGICRTVRAGVLRLPRRAGARLGLLPDQVAAIEEECRAALTELGEGKCTEGVVK